jgi:hypothetical protein
MAPMVMAISLGACMSSSVYGQSDTGRVTGTVADATGAVIPGAQVVLTDTDTGIVQTKTTGSDGSFNFPAITRGHYRIETSANGFGSQKQEFELQVQQVETVDVKLTTGATTQTIDVTSTAPIVDVSTSSTGEVVEGRQVVDLPLGQRNFLQLTTLTPGVTRGAYGSDASGINGNVETLRYADSGGGALTVNGLRPQANNFLLDGTDNNESLVNTIVVFPSPDAIQEFRVTTRLRPLSSGVPAARSSTPRPSREQTTSTGPRSATSGIRSSMPIPITSARNHPFLHFSANSSDSRPAARS